jgi:hypothetical protein
MKTRRLPVSTCVALDAEACATACWTTRSNATVGSGSTDAGAGHRHEGALEHVGHALAQRRQVRAARGQLLARGRLFGDGEQQMLQADGVVDGRRLACRKARWIVSSVSRQTGWASCS